MLKIVGVIVVVAAIAIGAVWYTSGIHQVEVGTMGIVKNWGQPESNLRSAGYVWINPIGQELDAINIQTQAYTDTAAAMSSDMQDVSTEVTLNYRVDPNEALAVYTGLGQGYEAKVVKPAVQETVKAVMSKFTAVDLANNRTAVKAMIDSTIGPRIAKYGLIVDQISLTNFQFSSGFQAAIDAKQIASQAVLTAQYQLQQKKVEAEQAVATAQGQRDSAIAAAEGQAKTIELNAQAQADAIQKIQDSLKGSPDYLNYLAYTKWDGAVPMVSGGGQQGGIPLILNLPTKPSP